VVRAYVVLVLARLRRDWQAAEAQPEARSPHVADLVRIRPALQLLHAAPAGLVTVTAAAEACGLSRSHFQAVFRHTMGMAFGEFRTRARLNLAAHLLLTSDLTLSAIAAEAGFVDPSHLHRRFHARYGCTPSEYRRQGRETVGRKEKRHRS